MLVNSTQTTLSIIWEERKGINVMYNATAISLLQSDLQLLLCSLILSLRKGITTLIFGLHKKINLISLLLLTFNQMQAVWLP